MFMFFGVWDEIFYDVIGLVVYWGVDGWFLDDWWCLVGSFCFYWRWCVFFFFYFRDNLIVFLFIFFVIIFFVDCFFNLVFIRFYGKVKKDGYVCWVIVKMIKYWSKNSVIIFECDVFEILWRFRLCIV